MCSLLSDMELKIKIIHKKNKELFSTQNEMDLNVFRSNPASGLNLSLLHLTINPVELVD